MDRAIGLNFCSGMGADYEFAQRQTLYNARSGYLRILYPYHPYFGQSFEVFGSAGGLRDLVYMCGCQTMEGIQRTVSWLPNYQHLLRMLKNLTYAGAFAYGRTQCRRWL